MDLDGDGSPIPDDCDPNDPGRFPGAVESCDLVDQDCDGLPWEAASISVAGDDSAWSAVADFATVGEALDGAAVDATICAMPGTYTENLVVDEGASLRLEGAGGAEQTILDGGGAGSVLSLNSANLYVRGFTIAGGEAPRGGGIYATASGLKLVDVLIEGNVATGAETEGEEGGEGGGIYAEDDSSITLVSSTVSDNVATGVDRTSIGGQGGGIYIEGGTLVVSASTLQGNRATLGEFDDTGGGASLGYGGGVFAKESDLQLDDATIQDNMASTGANGYGGGLYMQAGYLTTNRTVFQGNRAPDSSGGGGGIAADNTDLALTDTTIGTSASPNCTRWHGGGLYLATTDENIPATLTRVLIQGNVAGNCASDEDDDDPVRVTDGGGMYVVKYALTITDSVIQANQADEAGGVEIANGGDSLVTMDGIRLWSNVANSYAAGIYLYYGGLTAVHLDARDNVSADDGGAFVSKGAGSISISSSLFACNYAGDGTETDNLSGGISVTNAALDGYPITTLTLSNVTLYANSTWGEGGALYANGVSTDEQTDLHIDNSSFSRNSAEGVDGGGAIAIEATASLSVAYSHMYGNTDPAVDCIDCTTPTLDVLGTDPLFASADAGACADPLNLDLHPTEGSPLLGAGEGGRDIGAYGGPEGDTWPETWGPSAE